MNNEGTLSFLGRNERCRADEKARPVLLPLFYLLSLQDCAECHERIYGADSEHREVLGKSGFFAGKRQAECSTKEAVAALKGLAKHSGVEVRQIGGSENQSSAAVVEESVKRVLDYMRSKGLL